MSMNIHNLNINNNTLMCMAEEGIIYSLDYQGTKTQVGYTNDYYNELQTTTQEYYDKLVELGEIVPPKTQEEINEELKKELEESKQMNIEILSLLKEMQKTNGGGQNGKQRPVKQGSSDISTVEPK